MPGSKRPLRSAERLVVPSFIQGEYYFGIRQSRHHLGYRDWLAHFPPLTEIATINSVTVDVYADIGLEMDRIKSCCRQSGLAR